MGAGLLLLCARIYRMSCIKTECPRCETFQEFVVHKRKIGTARGIIEIYISCRRCPYESILRKSTLYIEGLIRYKSSLRQRAANLLKTHGAIPTSLAKQTEEVTNKIFQAQLELQKDLDEANR
jgi:hypothetical protein